jgi:integrase
MASRATVEIEAEPDQNAQEPGASLDFELRSIGRSLPRTDAPEGWVKKVNRAREGRVWVGYFHVWEGTLDGRRIRRKKEKTLGPATKPRHEALEELSEYIAEHTGKLAKQGEAITTFAELWKAYRAVKSGQWSKKTRENLKCLFAKHVLPQIGNQRIRELTLTPLQLLLNGLADARFSKSAVGQIRTYVRSCFEYAVDEDLIPKNPARKLVMPKVRKKPCERFLSVDEFRALLSQASPREHLILRILAVCGLRPAEALVLRVEDFEGSQLRIDEALKERQAGEDRIGDTKTDESDSFVPVPPDLAREIEVWIAGHPHRQDPRAFLFPSSSGTAFSVANYLNRHLKPLAELAGVPNVTHQAFRRTSSTYIQSFATVKDMQRHLRHTDPHTTLKHYAKVIPESLRTAVAALDARITGTPAPE